MNQQQVKYLRERIDTITKTKIKQLSEAAKLPKLCMSMDEKFKAIKSGAVVMKPIGGFDAYTKVHEAYVYSDEVKIAEAYKKAKKVFDAATEKVRKESANLVDEIMLGDAEQALAKLQKFEQS